MKISWRFIPILFFLLLSVFLWRGLFLDPHQVPSAKLGKPLPNLLLPELDNPSQSFSFKSLNGQVTVLNVWASWCSACVEEQVFLMQLAREGVLIYGMNYKDERKNAQHWLKQWGNPYQLVVQDKEGRAAIDLGVYGTPETFIIDKKGLIRFRHVGVMTQNVWDNTIAPLMKKLEQRA